MKRDLTTLERKLSEHIGMPVVVVYDTRGPRMPATGIIRSSKVFQSDDGKRAYIPMDEHASFDMVSRRPRIIAGPIPIDSIVRFKPESLLDKLIRIGELDIRRLRKELEKTLAEGPGSLVDITGADNLGTPTIERRTLDPLWQIAHRRSVEAFKSILNAEIAMISVVLESMRGL